MGNVNDSKVDYWLTDDGLLLISSWVRDGLIQDEICQKIGVSRGQFIKWKKKYPEIADAVKTSKEIVDYQVENALLKAALGYKKKSIKVTLGKKILNGEIFEVLKETTTEEVGPNVTACMAWLNNRKHDQWKRNRDKTLELSEEDSNINITIVRGPQTEAALGENTNTEVKFESKPKESAETVEKAPQIDENDKDYWPDDWEDDDDFDESAD